MRKRCYTCKCLKEESPSKFYQRTKDNPKARFHCRRCDPVRKERIKKTLEKSARTREAKKEVKHFKDVCRTEVERIDQERKIKFKKWNQSEEGKKGRRRYLNTDRGRGIDSIKNYNARIRRMKKNNVCYGLSDEEKIAMGRFYRKCPEGCEVDHIIPLSKGGHHEFSNLQYLAKEEHLKKSSKERTKKIKSEILETCPFTPMPEDDQEIELNTKKRNKGSKYQKVRRLVIK